MIDESQKPLSYGNQENGLIIPVYLSTKEQFISRTNEEFIHPSLQGTCVLSEGGKFGYRLTTLTDGKIYDCETFEDHFYPLGIVASCEYSKVKYIKNTPPKQLSKKSTYGK